MPRGHDQTRRTTFSHITSKTELRTCTGYFTSLSFQDGRFLLKMEATAEVESFGDIESKTAVLMKNRNTF